jgi:hypothetical protein
MGKYCLTVEKQQIEVDASIRDHYLEPQKCTGMGRLWLDIDCRADCQEQLSILEILVVLVVSHRYMLFEVVRILVVDHAEIQFGFAADSAAVKTRKSLWKPVGVAAAVV